MASANARSCSSPALEGAHTGRVGLHIVRCVVGNSIAFAAAKPWPGFSASSSNRTLPEDRLYMRPGSCCSGRVSTPDRLVLRTNQKRTRPRPHIGSYETQRPAHAYQTSGAFADRDLGVDRIVSRPDSLASWQPHPRETQPHRPPSLLGRRRYPRPGILSGIRGLHPPPRYVNLWGLVRNPIERGFAHGASPPMQGAVPWKPAPETKNHACRRRCRAGNRFDRD